MHATIATGQRTALETWFSPTMQVPGMELRLSGLAESTFNSSSPTTVFPTHRKCCFEFIPWSVCAVLHCTKTPHSS